MDIRALIAGESGAIDQVMRDDLGELGIVAPLLADILEYGLFGGGKRVRPFLVVTCSRLFGSPHPSLYRLAIAFEYLHAATLFHDDVIDRADTRRGRLSVVKRFGTAGAILAGDFLHAQAMALVGRHGGESALAVFTAATRGMAEGEFLQMRAATTLDVSEATYYAVIRRKTASLIAAACEIGGLYGGADEEQQAALQRYGDCVGCAFQIIDDLLDYQGDQQKTGKAVGNDLIEGKITLPLIFALHQAPPDEHQRIVGLLADEVQRRDRFSEVFSFIERRGGFAAARQEAGTLIDEAIAALDTFGESPGESRRTALAGLARYVLARRH